LVKKIPGISKIFSRCIHFSPGDGCGLIHNSKDLNFQTFGRDISKISWEKNMRQMHKFVLFFKVTKRIIQVKCKEFQERILYKRSKVCISSKYDSKFRLNRENPQTNIALANFRSYKSVGYLSDNTITKGVNLLFFNSNKYYIL